MHSSICVTYVHTSVDAFSLGKLIQALEGVFQRGMQLRYGDFAWIDIIRCGELPSIANSRQAFSSEACSVAADRAWD